MNSVFFPKPSHRGCDIFLKNEIENELRAVFLDDDDDDDDGNDDTKERKSPYDG